MADSLPDSCKNDEVKSDVDQSDTQRKVETVSESEAMSYYALNTWLDHNQGVPPLSLSSASTRGLRLASSRLQPDGPR